MYTLDHLGIVGRKSNLFSASLRLPHQDFHFLFLPLQSSVVTEGVGFLAFLAEVGHQWAPGHLSLPLDFSLFSFSFLPQGFTDQRSKSKTLLICLNELGAAGGGSFPLPEGGRRFVADKSGTCNACYIDTFISVKCLWPFLVRSLPSLLSLLQN